MRKCGFGAFLISNRLIAFSTKNYVFLTIFSGSQLQRWDSSDQTYIIIDPVAFGGIDDAQLRAIHGNFRLDVFTHHHVIEIRDLLLALFGNQKTGKHPCGIRGIGEGRRVVPGYLNSLRFGIRSCGFAQLRKPAKMDSAFRSVTVV
jgi:hypothetical protein